MSCKDQLKEAGHTLQIYRVFLSLDAKTKPPYTRSTLRRKIENRTDAIARLSPHPGHRRSLPRISKLLNKNRLRSDSAIHGDAGDGLEVAHMHRIAHEKSNCLSCQDAR